MGSKWSLPWPTTTIDRIEQLGDIEFSFEKLRRKYGTFRSYSNGTDRLGRKKFRSRVGVQTDYGDTVSVLDKSGNVMYEFEVLENV